MNKSHRQERREAMLKLYADLFGEIEKPSPIPVGAPGSTMRRAWDLGRRLAQAESKAKLMHRIVERLAEAEVDDTVGMLSVRLDEASPEKTSIRTAARALLAKP